MKRLTTLLLLLLTSVAVMASPVKLDEATRVASHFWTAVSSQPVEEIHALSNTGFSEFYVFDVNQGSGFVIVSADDAAYPILGYSTNSPASDMGPETRFWLNQYAAEIVALAAGTVEVEPALQQYVKKEWNQMTQGSWQPPKATTTVPQLLTTQWNQSPYYNDLCPSGTPVGCTATATAQIMKFWNHPVVGNGAHSYYASGYGMLSADFGNTTYDWDNMPNRLTGSSSSDQRTAVATLCYHVGVAVDMNYGPDGSGASVLGYGASAQSALVNYFNYENTLSGVYKYSYSDAEWVQLLKSELDEGRPILYAGYDSEAGHAFVFDGYSSNSQFHVNWGWGGSYDGYFAMGALNPGGGGVGSNTSNTFNNSNQALIGIEPKPTLAATPSPLIFDVNGGNASFEVRSDFGVEDNWVASVDASWLTFTPNAGLGNGAITTVNVTATPNATGASRSATITVVQGNDTLLVPVHQHACEFSSMCILNVNMTDRSGDGWGDSHLSFSSTSGVLYGTASLRAGSYGTQSVQVCPDTVVVTWHGSGYSDDQCSFFVDNADGIMWLQHEQGATFVPSDTILAPCARTGGTPTFTYRLEVEPSDSTYGVVTGADSNIRFGEYRTIQAVANPGYRFYRWSDNVYDNPRDVIVIRDRSLTARFYDLQEDTLQYDNDHYQSFSGNGDGYRWGIKVNPADLIGRPTLNGVKFYCGFRGRYNVYVYQNAGSMPSMQVYSQSINLSWRNVGKWYYMSFDTPVTINHSRSLWIFIEAPGVRTPAALTAWCGNENGSWYSENSGSTWGVLDPPSTGTWMVRAVMPIDHHEYTLRVSSTRPSWGTTTGSGQFRYGETVRIQALPTEGHHFVRWNDYSTENPRNVVVKSDSTIRAIFGEGEVAIDNPNAAGIEITTQGRSLHISGAPDLSVHVYDLLGRSVYLSERYDGSPIPLPAAGVYMVRIEDMPAQRVAAFF